MTSTAGAPDLGMSSNVVIRLSETIPRNVNHKLFFDNWFCSVGLMRYLSKQNILRLGTVRLNRIRRCNMPSEKKLKQKGRGSMLEKLATVNDIGVSVVSW
jgi:hypothetical protein